MHRRIPASLAVLSLMLMLLLFPSSSQAQINGAPASVTSPSFGGRAINGTPPSVTSLGPRGFTPNAGVQFFSSSSRHDRDRDRDHDRKRDRDHHRRSYSSDFFPYYYGGLYAVPVPYADDATSDSADDDSNYQGGPTIFDRRGPGAEAYIPPVRDARPAHAPQIAASDPPAPESPQPPTVLVFKDGRQLEVGNYAIVGQTLYDLTPGHPRRIALSDLDVDATQKLNDDRGVNFQLPPAAQGS